MDFTPQVFAAAGEDADRIAYRYFVSAALIARGLARHSNGDGLPRIYSNYGIYDQGTSFEANFDDRDFNVYAIRFPIDEDSSQTRLSIAEDVDYAGTGKLDRSEPGFYLRTYSSSRDPVEVDLEDNSNEMRFLLGVNKTSGGLCIEGSKYCWFSIWIPNGGYVRLLTDRKSLPNWRDFVELSDESVYLCREKSG